MKLAIHNIPHVVPYPSAYQKHFSPKTPLVIVTFGGRKLKLSPNCLILPLAELHDYLCEL